MNAEKSEIVWKTDGNRKRINVLIVSFLKSYIVEEILNLVIFITG